MENIKFRTTYTKVPILGSRKFRTEPKGIEILGIKHKFTNEDIGKHRALTIQNTTLIGKLSGISSESIEFDIWENIQIITKGTTKISKMTGHIKSTD